MEGTQEEMEGNVGISRKTKEQSLPIAAHVRTEGDAQRPAAGRLCMALLYTAPIAGAGASYFLRDGRETDALSALLPGFIIIVAYFAFLRAWDGFYCQKIAHPTLYFGVFFLSFLFMGIASAFSVGVLWMSIVVFAALDGGLELALSSHFALMAQYVFLLLPVDGELYRFSGYFLFGMVLALLFSLFDRTEAVPFLALILMACDGALQFVACHFSLGKVREMAGALIAEEASVLLLVLLGLCYYKAFGAQSAQGIPKVPVKFFSGKKEAGTGFVQGETTETDGTTVQESAVIQKNAVMQDTEKDTVKEEAELLLFEALADPDFALMQKLKDYSETLYHHSQKVAELSAQAAKAVGGNPALARVGGLYHEMGRIREDGDYIEMGIQMGTEYHFPELLLDVIRQHSSRVMLPKSAEAAVVMLSDCIVSTSEYLEKNGQREIISDAHLVQGIFRNRLEKGNLQDAGLTREQIACLRDFYRENISLIGEGIQPPSGVSN